MHSGHGHYEASLAPLHFEEHLVDAPPQLTLSTVAADLLAGVMACGRRHHVAAPGDLGGGDAGPLASHGEVA